MNNLPSILGDIVQARLRHTDEIRSRLSHVNLDTLAHSERSLYDNVAREGTQFIMECKSSSPSLGMIRADYQPGEIASVYSRYAAGISVLCEPERFGGDYDHLATVASITHLPVLCKDFIVDEIQVYAARYFGADAILLMMSVLDDDTYTHLSGLAERLDMDVLTEVIDEEEAARAARLGAKLFGINHRNLHDLSIDLGRSARLAPMAPEGALVVSESGIRNVNTVRELGAHSDGFLVGSRLTGEPDIDVAARKLVFGSNKVCGLTQWSAAQAARASGAVYGGLIYDEDSPRNVSRETSGEIIAREPHLQYVAVSRRTEKWSELIQDGIHAVQIHAPFQGSLEAELNLVHKVRDEVGDGIEVWRAVSMTRPEGAQLATALLGSVDTLVLDARDGGSGTSFDWASIPEEVKDHSLLAGGINPANINEALRVGCRGVDLNSGVEYPLSAGQWAGRKDTAALRSTFLSIRNFHF